MRILEIFDANGKLLGWWFGDVHWGHTGETCIVGLWPNAPTGPISETVREPHITGYEVKQVVVRFADDHGDGCVKYYLVAIGDGMSEGFWSLKDAVRFTEPLM